MDKKIFVRQSYLLAIAVAGCTGLPPLSDVGVTAPGRRGSEPPPVAQIIRHVECEIARALSVESGADIQAFLQYDYVLYVSLTLDETFNEGLTPSLSYIKPFATAGTNFTLSASGELTGQQHRNFVQNFSIDLDTKVLDDAIKGRCSTLNEASGGIKGNLGLRQVIVEGGRHRDPAAYVFPLVGEESNLTQQQKDAVAAVSGGLLPTFASTVDFTLTYGLSGGGPTWTLTHFSGPGGGSGLVNYTKMNKNTILLSFASSQKHVHLLAPQDEAARAEEAVRKARAAQAAQANATRLILQQLRIPQ